MKSRLASGWALVGLLALAGCASRETRIEPAASSVTATHNEVRPIKRTRTTRTVEVKPPVLQMKPTLENAK